MGQQHSMLCHHLFFKKLEFEAAVNVCLQRTLLEMWGTIEGLCHAKSLLLAN